MDINELKSVNDNIGHDAGDELIVGASKCMKKVLAKYGKVYRTGGDEFCAIMYCGKTEPGKIIAKFKDEVSGWKGKHVDHLSVSTGYVMASEMETPNLRDMSILADKLMYEDKSAYYRKKGVDRRGQKDSRAALCAIYSKILKINITKDEYQVISFDSDEKLVSEKISEVFAECGRTCNIHPDDLEKYIAQTNMAYLKDYFARKKKSLTIYYRVKSGEEYVNKTIEMIPAEDYTDEDQNLYLYVRVVE
jgi:diguanylate cyclase (GGDEF)-like protein